MERHSFRRVSGESPETLRRLCLSIKFAHEEIRKKFRHFAQLLVFWKLSKSFQVLSCIKYKLFNSLYVLDCPLLNTFFSLSFYCFIFYPFVSISFACVALSVYYWFLLVVSVFSVTPLCLSVFSDCCSLIRLTPTCSQISQNVRVS